MAPFENGAMFGSAAHLDDMRSRIGKGGNGIPLDRFAVDDKAHRTALFVAIAYDQAVAPVHAFRAHAFPRIRENRNAAVITIILLLMI